MNYSGLDLKSFEALAFEFAKGLKAGDVVLFEGEMGAGKTCFIKNILSFFGVKDAISPTFSIVNVHKNEKGEEFFHLDLHRLKPESDEIEYIGIDEILKKDAIVLIEWSDYYREYFKANKIGDYRVKIGLCEGDFDLREVGVDEIG
ncbi:MAG: tRNA ((37)-N6)-threonylcarbamoyltransferase complex ATPase subunit type 1 TsaE [Pseudomonadota bacterium]|jgi:tRNA threonylcarbamoyladenosine biosynthesis protein TsaE